MRTRAWLCAAILLALATGVGSCRKYVTVPTMRLPVITSIVAFPTVLGVGDSTMITINATDPDGDPLVYDWEGYNGLVMRGPYGEGPFRYRTHSPSMVFYRSAGTSSIDTAFVWCTVWDNKFGSDQHQVLLVYKN